MRLTLRTLLAYLDDTLEPREIKQIGQKVAESDAAQELIARLKQVTRRRRLTTPADTGQGELFDPNTVAAYLDNELPSEQVAELEKLCLESDVHLAEIAACHQILTLVLGEPALVPPTAKERMYALVKGREAIPFRKAPALAAAGDSDADDSDDAMMSVLAFHRRQNGWKRWALLGAGVLLFLALPVVLIAALLQGSNPSRETHPIVTNLDKTNGDKEKDVEPPKDKTKDAVVKDKSEKDADAVKDKSDKDNSVKDSGVVKDKSGKDSAEVPDKSVERHTPPSKERHEVALYQGSAKPGSRSILVQRPDEAGSPWKRVSSNTPVYTSDHLVSLPGYTSEIKSDSGVRLQLWGTVPRFTPAVLAPLFESAVTLHANPKFDLDLTLDRGRLFLANAKDKGPARVRLRFEKEVWDVTLSEPDSEVVVELGKVPMRDTDWTRDEPKCIVRFCVLQGKAGLKVDYVTYPDLSFDDAAFFHWDNYGRGLQGPAKLEKSVQDFSKEIPANDETNRLRAALDGISQRIGEKKAVSVGLKEIINDDSSSPLQRSLCIVCLGAVDAIPAVLDILDSKDEARAEERFYAIVTLDRWISRGLDYNKQLFDMKDRRSGILIDKKYTPNEAGIVMTLLHEFDDVKRKEPETFDWLAENLTHNKMAIRELAAMHLRDLSVGVKTIPPYNAAWDLDKRTRAADEWKAMVKKGELPPPAPPPPGPPGGPPK
jgi:hypothetical protein